MHQALCWIQAEVCKMHCGLQLTGTLPAFLAEIGTLTELELESNQVRLYCTDQRCLAPASLQLPLLLCDSYM